MDDAFLVRRLQAGGDLNCHVEPCTFAQPQRSRRDMLAQRLTLQQFHDDKGMAFVLIEFVDRADVGMTQRRDGASLALEALQGFGLIA